MNDEGFRRARRPEQKAERRAAILRAAAGILHEAGMEGITLGAIAARAGIVKSNVYRYFESREHVLAEILRADLAEALDEIAAAFAAPGFARSPAAAAAAMAGAYARRPRLCLLTSRMASVLEENLSEDAVAAFKRAVLGEVGRAVGILLAAFPVLSPEAGFRAALHLHIFVAGLWPATNPGPRVAAVTAREEFRPFAKAFGATLEAEVRAHLAGLLAETTG